MPSFVVFSAWQKPVEGVLPVKTAMTDFVFHASQEQFSPASLLKYAVMAEQAGFDAIHSSDHFHPWSERQGHSGFSFSWLGAAMQATALPFGMVCAPGQRYHPAIVAQAAATLADLFPGRLWMSLGSGEALNENITGQKWPSKSERNLRLQECTAVIRKLFAGELVNHIGRVVVENARLYTLPERLPPLLGAALSEATATWMAPLMDGLLTTAKPYSELVKVVNAFRNHGGERKPVYLKVQLSYSRDEKMALDGAYDQWRMNIFEGSVLGEMSTVAQFDAASQFIKPEDLADKIHISSQLDHHVKWLKWYMELGFDKIILHNVNREQETFIEDFGKYVLPQLKM